MSRLWYLLGSLVDLGGVANLKTVPIYQGVTDVFLRLSCTGPDETLATWGSIEILCDCPVGVTE